MKNFSFESRATPETKMERLAAAVAQTIRAADAEIAVEVYGFGIGRSNDDKFLDEVVAEEAREVLDRHRAELVLLLDGVSVADEVLAIFDLYATGEKTATDAMEMVKETILASSEQEETVAARESAVAEYFAGAKEELLHFLDEQIISNQSNRAVMSMWGDAKVGYDTGDTTKLRTVLKGHLATLTDATDRATIERFLQFVER